MRQIKFRGKSPCFNTWLFGDLVRAGDTTCICEKGSMEMDGHHIRQFADRPQFVNENTIGQYTGLKDKNGKEVYEGDIVVKKDLTLNLTYTGVVIYNERIGAFRLHVERNGYTQRQGFEASDSYDDGKCVVICKYEYEVIGNIYDNENLLVK